jgi:hypothetical protein
MRLILVAGFSLVLAACSNVAPTSTTAASAVVETNVPSRTPEAFQSATNTPAADWWRPQPGAIWQIQFTGDQIDTSLAVDVYELDLFDTPRETVASLHAAGRRVVCYLSAGSWEDWRPDAADFPETLLANELEGWPGERWVDIGQLDALAPILAARLDLCAAKGFDGVDPDNLDGFTNNTGTEISAVDAIALAEWLSAEAHARGLGIALKNVPELFHELVGAFDWVVVESCFVQGWCEETATFSAADKAVFAIEYVEEGVRLSDFCAEAGDLKLSAIVKNRDLDAWVEACP